MLTLRLVLRQPSPVWRTFHIEDLNVYHDLPRRVPRPIQHSHIIDLVHCQVRIKKYIHLASLMEL